MTSTCTAEDVRPEDRASDNTSRIFQDPTEQASLEPKTPPRNPLTQFVFCAAAQNQKNPQVADIEKTHTAKTALVDALRASFGYCDSAYAMTDAQALGTIGLPDWGKQSPLSVLILNIAHNNEHYGNVVTYLRLRGLVPPSSQPARK